jgi:hypothetical protein
MATDQKGNQVPSRADVQWARALADEKKDEFLAANAARTVAANALQAADISYRLILAASGSDQ